MAHVYLHWGSEQRRAFLQRCAAGLAPGGALVVVGHDRSNIAEGHGGPQNPELLTTPDELRELFESHGLAVERAELVYRDLEITHDDGTVSAVRAIDHVAVARKPAPV